MSGAETVLPLIFDFLEKVTCNIFSGSYGLMLCLRGLTSCFLVGITSESLYSRWERELLFNWWPPGSSPPTSTLLIQSCCFSVCLMSFPNWQKTRILRNCHILGDPTQQDLDFWQHKVQEESLLPGKIKSGDCSWNGCSKRVSYSKSIPVDHLFWMFQWNSLLLWGSCLGICFWFHPFVLVVKVINSVFLRCGFSESKSAAFWNCPSLCFISFCYFTIIPFAPVCIELALHTPVLDCLLTFAFIAQFSVWHAGDISGRLCGCCCSYSVFCGGVSWCVLQPHRELRLLGS